MLGALLTSVSLKRMDLPIPEYIPNINSSTLAAITCR